MKKKDFTDLICAEMAKGGERFCVSATAYAEAVLYWTNAKGVVRKQGEAPLRTVGLNQKEDSGIPALALRINGSKSPVRTVTGATACQECTVVHLLCQHFTRIMNRPYYETDGLVFA
ncbi:hypothetical protein P9883_026495 [Klebsiella pneumoniae]|uniref:hypothetical protein n=1 Tax=Klebsiella pneumoniae TaxID=573 RepID=UPI00254B9983|nr:hypothetical protein [Klebsiella pneumoniae]MEC5583630.1 hypothetical protein [Klebsiella pneumoniae]